MTRSISDEHVNEGSESAYQEIEHRLSAWALDQKDVRALVVVGSRATPNATRDAFSDLDVLLVAGRPRSYVDEVNWLDQIERPWLTYVIQTPLGERIARGAVFREGQVTVDFAVVGKWSLPGATLLLGLLSRFPRVASWMPSVLSNQLAALSGMLRAGTRVLVDKDGAAGRLARTAVSWPRRAPPSEREFADVGVPSGDLRSGPPKSSCEGTYGVAPKGGATSGSSCSKWSSGTPWRFTGGTTRRGTSAATSSGGPIHESCKLFRRCFRAIISRVSSGP